MVVRFFTFLIGFGLAVVGGVSIIAYLNLLTQGKSFLEYLYFLSEKAVCYLLPLGVVIILVSIFWPSRNGNKFFL